MPCAKCKEEFNESDVMSCGEFCGFDPRRQCIPDRGFYGFNKSELCLYHAWKEDYALKEALAKGRAPFTEFVDAVLEEEEWEEKWVDPVSKKTHAHPLVDFAKTLPQHDNLRSDFILRIF